MRLYYEPIPGVPEDMVRLHAPHFSDTLGGVSFVDGVAQSPCPRPIAERLVACMGEASVRIVGPWQEPSPAPVAVPPPPAGPQSVAASEAAPAAASPPSTEPSAPSAPSAFQVPMPQSFGPRVRDDRDRDRRGGRR